MMRKIKMPSSPENFRIISQPDELREGLFGQVFLFAFEILPYLHELGSKPAWDICAKYYGAGTEGRVIPGVLDLAYVPTPATHDVSLMRLRRRHCMRLGNDFQELHDIWTTYFRIPQRVIERADALGQLDDALGIHYRGTDKIMAKWDTNPVSHSDFVAIIRDFLARRPNLKRVFVATDDNEFPGFLRSRVDAEVVNLGKVTFHKEADINGNQLEKADRAVLDWLLLSRCRAVLSGFTKVLQPDLEIYRCAASKLFNDIPYFPVAYIPRYETDNPEVKVILNRLMEDDWLDKVPPPAARFAAVPRRHRPSWRRVNNRLKKKINRLMKKINRLLKTG